jgi:hypothetical protein
MIVYLYFVLNLRKNITFYFMFIKDKNKIKDFEREIERERKKNLSVLENERRYVLITLLLKIHIDELKFQFQLQELSLFSYFIFYHGDHLFKILFSTTKNPPCYKVFVEYSDNLAREFYSYSLRK